MPHLASIADGHGMDAMMEDVQTRGLQEELKRLRDMHHVYYRAAGDKLTLAPVDLQTKGLKILDSATADGTWLQDVRKEAGEEVAKTQAYVGTDLVPELFPDPRPEWLQFYRQSITAPWPEELKGQFDLVHQRQVLGFCGDFPINQAVANLAELAKPGGWVELTELSVDQSILNDTNPVGRKFFYMMEQLWTLKGMGGNFGEQLKGWLEEAGLEDVEETLLKCKVGAQAQEGEEESSINGACGAAPMIIAMTKTLEGLQGFAPGELDSLGERLQQELREVGGTFHVFAVRGRVPAHGLKRKQ
ncbi:putative methyltransferase SirN-like protein [Teratosphaeria nubilosa]|uniref:Putative methyltransferase SirN-like protein n=1 Tax=Teratosphaeria nubilosa TaxID=161662 RepID=A0A6G1LK70_9PEZI|nr:putative methyltransferase SirN-like protein [Teratosphaeria nubilosa]